MTFSDPRESLGVPGQLRRLEAKTMLKAGNRVREGELTGTVLRAGVVLVQWRTDDGRLRASLPSELEKIDQ